MEKTPEFLDVHATADAIRILCELRLNYNAEMPLAAWKIIASAEAKLNRQIEEYFRGGARLDNARIVDTRVG
jgi:hypothetical protein